MFKLRNIVILHKFENEGRVIRIFGSSLSNASLVRKKKEKKNLTKKHLFWQLQKLILFPWSQLEKEKNKQTNMHHIK